MFDVLTVLSGIVAGVTYALTSYGKKEGQTFDANKFLTTIIIGIFSGLTMAITQIPIDLGYSYFINMGLIPVIENLLKILYRKVYLRFF